MKVENCMIDQSFSEENFRKIYDLGKRRGQDLDSLFTVFNKIQKFTNDVKKWNSVYREYKKQFREKRIPKDTFDLKVLDMNKRKQKTLDKREEEYEKVFEQISSNVSEKNFVIDLLVKKTKRLKDLYLIPPDSPENYFSLKQMQANLERAYKVRQSDRNHIVSCLKEVLNNKLSKHVIRTDISSFYESIPNEKLLQFIENDALLTFKNKALFKSLFKKYKDLSGKSIGIPRGIGVSAYLAELYMKKIDHVMKYDDRVIYYARYVDDIVVVTLGDKSVANAVFSELKEGIKELDLEINEEKTIGPLDFGGNNTNNFDYLGYSFSRNGSSSISINLSNRKLSKIKSRVDISFREFLYASYKNKKKASRMFLNRIKYLTGNTNLFGLKKKTMIGIYFSNPYLTEVSGLNELDLFLTERIDDLESTIDGLPLNFDGLITELRSLSFKDGFERKTFRNFKAFNRNTSNSAHLHEIVKVWKNV